MRSVFIELPYFGRGHGSRWKIKYKKDPSQMEGRKKRKFSAVIKVRPLAATPGGKRGAEEDVGAVHTYKLLLGFSLVQILKFSQSSGGALHRRGVGSLIVSEVFMSGLAMSHSFFLLLAEGRKGHHHAQSERGDEYGVHKHDVE